MAAGQLQPFLRLLRQTVAARIHGGLTDAELLSRFVARRDEAAFEVLVWRHGPLVWHTCRRVLGRTQDAEDAFQATFLALVRQARSVRRSEALAGWLHRVAHRTALRARADADKRGRVEKQTAQLPDAHAPAANGHDDLRHVLDEEINRLPERYRVPIILCYLEGKTNDEAARQLGCPRGTILSRLARARERLKARLLRRGVTPAIAGLGAAGVSTASAGVPAALVGGTVKAATGIAAGKAAAAVASAQVAALTEGVLHAMFLTKMKLAAGVMCAAVVVGSGLGFVTHGFGGTATAGAASAGQAGNPLAVQAQAPEKEQDRLRQLQAEADAQRASLQAQLQQLEAQIELTKARLAQVQRAQTAKPDRAESSAWSQAATLEGHTAPVYSVAFSPDGKLLASGGKDEQIRLWDAATGKLVLHFVGHARGVTHLAFSPDGRLLASVGVDNFICLWDMPSGRQVRRLQGKGKLSFRLAFTPDGKTLATAGADTGGANTGIQFWDVVQGQPTGSLTSSGNQVTSLAFAPDGKSLISAGLDRTVQLWDVSAGREVRRLQDYDDLAAAAFSPDGKLVAAGSKNGTVILWDAATGKQLNWHRNHRDMVMAVVFSPDGNALISISQDRTILSFSLSTGELVQIGRHEAPIMSLAVSPDGKTVASAGQDNVVRLWRVARTTAAHSHPSPPPPAGGGQGGGAPAGDRLNRLLKELLDGNRGDEQIVEALYLAALARLPKDAEQKDARKLLAQTKDRRLAFEQLLRTLTNSKKN